MPDDILRLRIAGREILLVPASAIEQWNEEHARRQLLDAAQDWPTRDAILQLSDDLLGDGTDPARAIEHLAHELELGRLVAVRIPTPAGRVSSLGEAPADWDELPRLSDLSPSHAEGGEPWTREPPRPPATTDVPEIPETPASSTHFVAFEVVDQDGAALAGTYLTSQLSDALANSPTRVEGPSESLPRDVGLEIAGYQSPRRSAPSLAMRTPAADHDVELAALEGVLALELDRLNTIVVRVPKATVFTLPAYSLDLEVFRPGWLWFDADASEGVSGIGCLAQILDYARAHPERHVLTVGHTDTSGTKSHNRDVSDRRAQHLAALLRADVDAWVASCVADGVLADLAAHMQWAARRFGWACDAGIVAKQSAAFDAALAQWRSGGAELTGISIDPEASPSADDWRLAYALIDIALAEELDLDLAALAELRAGLLWCAPQTVGAGELWPRELVGKNGVASAVNRRTEVMFATTPELPHAESPDESLFGDDALLWLDNIDPEPRAALPLALSSADGIPVASAAFKIVSNGGRVRHGALGPDGETIVDDLVAGDFLVHWTDPDDVVHTVWSERCRLALATNDLAMLRRFVMLTPALVRAAAQRWSTRFADGDPQTLAITIRVAVADTEHALAFDYLLDRAGFPGDVHFETDAEVGS